MKKIILALTAAAACASAPVLATTNVGISVGIYQPGTYGRIDIGEPPPPVAVMYPQPVVIQPTPVAVYQRPIYMYVPVAQQHDWRHYCGRYAACGQPVYFVKEDWVRQRWQQEHHEGPRDWHDRDNGPGRGHGNGHGHGHDNGWHGGGHGHGHGH